MDRRTFLKITAASAVTASALRWVEEDISDAIVGMMRETVDYNITKDSLFVIHEIRTKGVQLCVAHNIDSRAEINSRRDMSIEHLQSEMRKRGIDPAELFPFAAPRVSYGA